MLTQTNNRFLIDSKLAFLIFYSFQIKKQTTFISYLVYSSRERVFVCALFFSLSNLLAVEIIRKWVQKKIENNVVIFLEIKEHF